MRLDNNTQNSGAVSADLITLAVLAVGGQGGGVLSNWIADLATRCNYAVQMTSVAGVAQRTGATIYYVEMAPKTDRQPVFALSPTAGDLDVLIASELMEAGRAVLRGFVTPDRTTLIASTHRILAISEKSLPGDGRAEHSIVEEEIHNAAFKSVCFDMESIASKAGSMISASLFGALARSGCLPFAVPDYEAVIRASGRGVEASLAAFNGALNYEPQADPGSEPLSQVQTQVQGPSDLCETWNTLCSRVNLLPEHVHGIVSAGLIKVVDYQDIDYGREYLSYVEEFLTQDESLLKAAAKYLANAMCYDDLIRVADLKTRASRQSRLRQEQDIPEGELVHVTEYFHPRAREICGTIPAKPGAWIESHPRIFSLLDRLTNRGRRIRTDGIFGFCMLWFVAGLKPHRRKFLRHRYESVHLEDLLSHARHAAQSDTKLAAEILKCQRLIKGYSDTHERGHGRFTKVIETLKDLSGRRDAHTWIRRLRKASLEDLTGAAFDDTLARMRSEL